jgi:lysophospholipid acyltransferase (LPLAT)-like uncharacterized protein
MRLRHPALIRAAGVAGSWMLRLWHWTVPFSCQSLGLDVDPRRVPPNQRYLYAFWHEYLLIPTGHFGHANVCALISLHSDGQLITEVARGLGFSAVRGSTTRGGSEAVRGLLRASAHSHLAVTPDGPRGPRRVVQQGLVYLASRARLPVVPMGFGLVRPWRARSWDQMALPRPGCRATCLFGEPIWVPRATGRGELEHYRGCVEAALHEVTDMAQQWAETGRVPARQLPERRRLAA